MITTHLLLPWLGLLLASGHAVHSSSSPHQNTTKPFDCGTDTTHASPDFLSTIAALHSGSASGSPTARAALLTRDTPLNTTPITIPAIFHIVATEDAKSDISNDMPSAQLSALNAAYNPSNIAFTLENVTWTTNDAWATASASDAADTAMKRALRQGTYGTLNVYFQTGLAGGVLGRCTLPSSVGEKGREVAAEKYFSDGCNVNAHTMPGGGMEGYDSGKTAVHEIGHWMGLLHTFEGYSCEGPGDYIEDTAPERESTEGCPVGKRTCGEGAEEDPIHNYMDYSVDECYEGFTEMQVERMRRMWGVFREGR